MFRVAVAAAGGTGVSTSRTTGTEPATSVGASFTRVTVRVTRSNQEAVDGYALSISRREKGYGALSAYQRKLGRLRPTFGGGRAPWRKQDKRQHPGKVPQRLQRNLSSES